MCSGDGSVIEVCGVAVLGELDWCAMVMKVAPSHLRSRLIRIRRQLSLGGRDRGSNLSAAIVHQFGVAHFGDGVRADD